MSIHRFGEFELERALWLKLGETLRFAGERDAARTSFAQAASAARNCARPDLLADAALGFGGQMEWAMPSVAIVGRMTSRSRPSRSPARPGRATRCSGPWQ